jgi:hypothetical protein
MQKTCYVAETDENGFIVCVWTRPKEKRTACVFDPKKHIFDHNKEAEYFGAKPMAIQSWIAAKLMDGSFIN